MNPLLTIIIPCYNSGLYLRDCLESIRSQAFSDYEVIMIDDGSTDTTGGIIDSYRNNDSRFRAIHQQNSGVSAARNAGLKAAKGTWICFVDSDDTLKPDALEYMMSIVSDELDLAFAGFEIYKDGIIYNKIPKSREIRMTNIELAKELFAPSDYNYQGYICSKIYKRSIIAQNHILFDENIKYNEDRLFTFQFLANAHYGAYSTKPVYEYYLHGDNTMSAIESSNFYKFETDLDAFIKIYELAALFNSQFLFSIIRKQAFGSYKYNLRLNKKYGGDDKITRTRLKSKIRTILDFRQYYTLEASRYYYAFKTLGYKIYSHIRTLSYEKFD